MSVATVKLVATVVPDTVADLFTSTIASTPAMSSLFIKGRAYGKDFQGTLARITRAILRLPALMQVLSAILCDLLEKHIAGGLPCVPECFIGARPKSRPPLLTGIY